MKKKLFFMLEIIWNITAYILQEMKRYILELIKEELLKICDDPSDGMIEFQNSNDEFIEDYWFDLTPKGRIELNKYGINTNNRIID